MWGRGQLLVQETGQARGLLGASLAHLPGVGPGDDGADPKTGKGSIRGAVLARGWLESPPPRHTSMPVSSGKAPPPLLNMPLTEMLVVFLCLVLLPSPAPPGRSSSGDDMASSWDGVATNGTDGPTW